jgi:hypothetical protein
MIVCMECGHPNQCPRCNGFVCEICGSELPRGN